MSKVFVRLDETIPTEMLNRQNKTHLFTLVLWFQIDGPISHIVKVTIVYGVPMGQKHLQTISVCSLVN